jgi:hypothetical protein
MFGHFNSGQHEMASFSLLVTTLGLAQGASQEAWQAALAQFLEVLIAPLLKVKTVMLLAAYQHEHCTTDPCPT